jgi:hypothetical protein
MRWLFLFVLGLNIAYVGWELSQSTEADFFSSANDNVTQLVLLNEVQSSKNKLAANNEKQSGAEKSSARNQVSEKKAVQSSAVKMCFTLGPFRDLNHLRDFTRAIKDYVSAASFRSRQEQEQSLFWVYIEPAETYKQAKAIAKDLQKKNVKDFYIINKGDHLRGISLGHFKAKDGAFAHFERIKQLGFNPVIEPVFRSYTVYWLDYRLTEGKRVPESVFDIHLTGKINRLDRSCS